MIPSPLRDERETWINDSLECGNCGQVWVFSRRLGVPLPNDVCPECNSTDLSADHFAGYPISDYLAGETLH